MVIDGESLQRFFKANKSRFRKCLEPQMACDNAAIRAHSVQNSQTFDLLAKDGHVIGLPLRFSKDGPELEFRPVGRNEASTFTGLCNEHDTAIFAPIETKPLDLSDKGQLFLFAYRSVTRELHVVMEAAIKLQTEYNSRVERSLDPPNEMSPAGLLATEYLIKAYQTYLYRTDNFDKAFFSGDHNEIEHDTILLSGQKPSIAVSSLFSLDDVQTSDDVVRVCLNVIPISYNETVVIFSYIAEDNGLARAALDHVLCSAGEYQKYELSKIIIDNIDNFFISPKHFESWSIDKVNFIKARFVKTIFRSRQIEDHPDLMLF
jgi:hypothetical protein